MLTHSSNFEFSQVLIFSISFLLGDMTKMIALTSTSIIFVVKIKLIIVQIQSFWTVIDWTMAWVGFFYLLTFHLSVF